MSSTQGLKVDFAELPFMTLQKPQADLWVIDRAIDGVPGDIHYINAYSIALAQQDSDYSSCLAASAANFADGRPIQLLSRVVSERRIAQVRGPQAFEDIMDRGRQVGLRHFLLGSTPQTLSQLKQSLEQRYPGVAIVGTESPPFKTLSDQERDEQDDRIRACRPHIVWVGLGTPKQDFEAARLAAAGFVAGAVGAAFDFSAGTKREAPVWMRRAGLEWLFRFMSEPRRLWRRYLIGNAQFLAAAWKRRPRGD